jgi:membrane fusion protein (multidrug efflux system)
MRNFGNLFNNKKIYILIVLSILALMFLFKNNPIVDDISIERIPAKSIQSVQVMSIESSEYDNKIVSFARTISDNTANVSSEIVARIIAIDKSVGDYVERGDLLAQLDSSNLQERLDYLLQKKAELDMEKRALSKLSLNEHTSKLSVEKNKSLAKKNTADIKLIKDEIRKTKIIAPISGFIEEKAFNEGEITETKGYFFKIIGDTNKVYAHINSAFLTKLMIGQPMVFKSNKSDDLFGKLDFISRDISTENNTILVEASLDSSAIAQNISGEIIIEIGSTPSMLIPSSSIILSGENKMGIFFINDNSKAVYSDIELMGSDGDFVRIKPPQGVSKINLVIVGQFFINDGLDVNIGAKLL